MISAGRQPDCGRLVATFCRSAGKKSPLLFSKGRQAVGVAMNRRRPGQPAEDLPPSGLAILCRSLNSAFRVKCRYLAQEEKSA